MLALSAFVLLICILASHCTLAQSQADDYSDDMTSHFNLSCTSTQTPCALGCCPFAEATCCVDGFECCQKGQTCIPYIGICIGIVNGEENILSLVSKKSTPVENLITACPPGTTQCGVDKCCRYPGATCCSDGVHCCPHGYRCDLPNKRCIRGSFNDIIPNVSKVTYIPALEVVKKSPYKSCPGSDKICPSYTSCCIADSGQWGCCPSLSNNGFRPVGSDCCDTVFGQMCCSGKMGKCTMFGCIQ